MQNRGFGPKPWVFIKSWVWDKIWWIMIKHVMNLLLFICCFTWYKPIWRSHCLLARSLGWRFSVWCCGCRSILRYKHIYISNLKYLSWIIIIYYCCLPYHGSIHGSTNGMITIVKIFVTSIYHSISIMMTQQKHGITELYDYQSLTTLNMFLILHGIENIFKNTG